MRIQWTIAVAAFCFVVTAGTASSAEQASGLENGAHHDLERSVYPSEFVSGMVGSAIEMLRDETLTLEERRAQFGSILRDGLDLDLIGRFVLGRYWKQATPEQRREYLKAFSAFTVKKYSVLVSEYTGEAFTFNVLSKTSLSESDVLVHTQIERPYAQPIKLVWRARNRQGRWRVIDVIAEGISFVVTQRSEFRSVIQRKGLDNLIQLLTKAATSGEVPPPHSARNTGD